MKLLHHSYGKARVRVLKVRRDGRQHSVKELDVSVMLHGDFDASYTAADNRLVVPTDTMKNTVQVLALKHLGAETEVFGGLLAEHFVKTYRQVKRADVRLSEQSWQRMILDGQPHPHSFCAGSAGRPFAHVTCDGSKTEVESGIGELLMMKSTESGFEGFVRDEYTTLAEARDRVFATKLKAFWPYRRQPESYNQTNGALVQAMLDVFARHYSPSVQVTLFQMGEAALKAAPEVEKITILMPNKHYLLANLAPFGVENKNELFIPTDEPHGLIEGTVGR
jgi:urate oxidase